MTAYEQRVIAQIDLEAVINNYREIRKKLCSETHMMAVVKADAYGHGAKKIAQVLQQEGVERFAVAIPAEGIQLREAGITVPILVLGYTLPADIASLITYDLIPTVFSYDMAQNISKLAKELKKKVKVHIKVDTGMGRIGFLPNKETIHIIKEIKQLPYIEIEGVFTHFSTADEADMQYTHKQYQKFQKFIKDAKMQGISFNVKHAGNSAGIMQHPYAHLNSVRPGIILYGLYPSKEINSRLNLKPAMSIKTQVVHVKQVSVGQAISYGRKYITTKNTKIATIPIGYADGYSRRLSSKGRVLIRGEYAPVIGNICMDQFMVDVSHIENICVGDEVVVMGQQGENEITAEEIADLIGTINYEVICMVGKRIPRIYIKTNRI